MNREKWEKYRKKHGLHEFVEPKVYFRGVLHATLSFIPNKKLAKERYDHMVELLEVL